jgi:hypothetical protein
VKIRDRQESELLQEGAQVTSTLSADYFYFRRGRQIVCVRFPTNDKKSKIEVMDRTMKQREMV